MSLRVELSEIVGIAGKTGTVFEAVLAIVGAVFAESSLVVGVVSRLAGRVAQVIGT